MKTKLIGSHSTKEKLHSGIEKYFYGSKITLNEDGTISNSKGKLDGLRWRELKGRYRFERVEKESE